MPVEIDAFVVAYRPKAIYVSCSSTSTEREEDDVRTTIVLELHRDNLRRAETLSRAVSGCCRRHGAAREREAAPRSRVPSTRCA